MKFAHNVGSSAQLMKSVFMLSVAKFKSGCYHARVDMLHLVHFESNRTPESASAAAVFPVSYPSSYYYACLAMLGMRASGD